MAPSNLTPLNKNLVTCKAKMMNSRTTSLLIFAFFVLVSSSVTTAFHITRILRKYLSSAHTITTSLRPISKAKSTDNRTSQSSQLTTRPFPLYLKNLWMWSKIYWACMCCMTTMTLKSWWRYWHPRLLSLRHCIRPIMVTLSA